MSMGSSWRNRSFIEYLILYHSPKRSSYNIFKTVYVKKKTLIKNQYVSNINWYKCIQFTNLIYIEKRGSCYWFRYESYILIVLGTWLCIELWDHKIHAVLSTITPSLVSTTRTTTWTSYIIMIKINAHGNSVFTKISNRLNN